MAKQSSKSTHTDTTPSTIHPAFELIRTERIDSLNILVEEYQHKKTGAQHFHIANNNSENVFLVGLRTIPLDSTGVAHILEHTALCGSKRYPVRDPFFMMIRRSLNTFMNAFTSSDWTAYPFASQNRKDFNNLLDVYLDAVFFANLDELDFAQEGHRVEFSDNQNPDSDLVYKGVVYNEMKGAMSSPVSTLWQTLSSHLFPTTTYHHNSGGDPEHIPDLDYTELKAFYKKHYHPSNAIFMTFGNIPAIEHHVIFEDRVLSHFNKQATKIDVTDEQRLSAPISLEDVYAIDSNEDSTNKTNIVIGWLLGRSIDMEAMLKAHLLSGVLLDNSASPLRLALETCSLGTAPSPLCGVEDSNREMSFMCGIEGSNPEHAEAIEQLILNVLQDVSENGIPHENIEAVLHQLELSQREISGDGYPYGLHLILSGLSTAIHRGDVFSALNPDPVLVKLREEIRDPDFIKQLVRSYLLDNNHRVRLTMKPDGHLAQLREDKEKQRLATIRQSLNNTQKETIINQAKALLERQMQQDDPSILPKVGLDDIPLQPPIVTGETLTAGNMPVSFYEQGTNGLCYQQIIVQLPQLDDELLPLLSLYTCCMTELGFGQKDYLTSQHWIDSISGGINAYTSVRGSIVDEQQTSGYFTISGKALTRNHAEFNNLMLTAHAQVRIDELPRIRELVAQDRARREQSITGQGHSLAMSAAMSGLSPAAALQHKLRGLQGIQSLKQLDNKLDEDRELQQLAEKFSAIHQQILSAPHHVLLIGEGHDRENLLQDINQGWHQYEQPSSTASLALAPIRQQSNQLWVTSTQVNFCSRAYPTVAPTHPDAAALDVLAGFLRNGYLHRAIREIGGAYGGGASHDSDNAAFRFYSYRDPRLTETLDDFDHALDWLQENHHDERQLEEAILGIFGSLDKPGSPAGEAKEAFYNELYGRDPQHRQQYRENVLNVSLTDLQRVGETYLRPESASTGIITNSNGLHHNDKLNLDVFTL